MDQMTCNHLFLHNISGSECNRAYGERNGSPPVISKIGPDGASIVGKLKPTAAILEFPPEEYSGVTETKMRTLTFST